MKKMKLLIIPLLFLSFMACDKKTNESENIEDSNVRSSTENLELYSSLLNDIDEKGLKASLSEYYKSNFSYSVSYLSGRTNYNVINYDRTCKIRNDSLYILKSTSYQYGSYEPEDSHTIYMKNNDSYYSYNYEYDVETGDCKFDKYVVQFLGDGVPDGMCIDKDGNIYVAEWGGFKVSKWNPETGECLKEYSIPVQNVSSCTIGGQKHDTLFITTAMHDDGTDSELFAGGIFKIQL